MKSLFGPVIAGNISNCTSDAITDLRPKPVPDRLVLIRQSSNIRAVSEAEVLPALSEALQALPRTDIHVDMRAFEADIEEGYWDRSESYILQQVQEIRAVAESANDPAIAFFGLAEVPHLLI